MRSIPLILVFLGATGIHSLAQNTDDAFQPRVNGTVRCVTAQPNGKLWVGGEFTQVTSTDIQNLACLEWDGGLLKEAPFLEPNGAVLSLLSRPDNALWVGGAFTEIGGEQRSGLARVVENDGFRVDAEFAPAFDGEVRCLLADGDGVLVGGNFLRVNGLRRAGVARLLENGEVDPAFDVKLEGELGIAVNTMVRQSDGKVLLGGLFDMAGRQAVTNLARLYPSGALDTRFLGSADGEVHAIGVQANGNVMVGGDFLNASGQPAERIARLDRQGDFLKTINGFGDRVNTIKIQPDGKVLIGGRFGYVPGSSGNLVRFGSELQVEKLASIIDGEVFCIMPQGDGHVLIGGAFTRADQGVARGLARLDINLRSETTIDTRVSVTGQITTAVQQPDEKLLFTGPFTSFGSKESGGLVRTNSNGVLDTEFVRPWVGGGLLGIQVRPDQRLWVFGKLSTVGDSTRVGIARLQQSGSLDTTFNANLGTGESVVVNAIADQWQDQLLLAGNFTNISQVPRTTIARVGSSGWYDGSFTRAYSGVPNELLTFLPTGDLTIAGSVASQSGSIPLTQWYNAAGNVVSSQGPQITGKVNGMCRLPDGKMLIWGDSPLRRSQHLSRMLANGKVDETFSLSFDREVRSVSVQADGSMLVLGAFTSYSSKNVSWKGLTGFIHLEPDLQRRIYTRTLSMGPAGQARAGLVQADGKFLFWGGFTSANGSRLGLARMAAAVPASQELGVVYGDGRLKLAWQRSGSAPEVERVWFSTSTNGTTWSSGIDATWANGRWEWDKFSFPFNKPVWIRAQGRVPSTGGGDAGGLVQATSQVFLEGEIDVALNGKSLISGDGDEINFGGQVQGVPAMNRAFTITNRGNFWLTLGDPIVPEGFIAGELPKKQLGPGEQITVEVTSDLSRAGVWTGELVIPSEDIDEKEFVIPLKSEALTPLRTTLLKPRAVLNRKTGLREQTIRVRNAAGITYAGYRVIVSGLPHGVELRNASEQLPDGSYVIVVNQELGPFAKVDLKLEYSFPKKTPAKLIPRINADVILVPAGE